MGKQEILDKLNDLPKILVLNKSDLGINQEVIDFLETIIQIVGK